MTIAEYCQMIAIEDSEFERLERLRMMASADPAAAVDEAAAVLRHPSTKPGTECVAWSALARALFDLGEHAGALEAARRSLTLLDELEDDRHAVLVPLTAAAILAEGGAVQDALAALSVIALPDSGPSAGRLLIQQAYVLHHAGELGAALECLDRADRASVGFDPTDRMRLLINRGVVLLQQGRLDHAQVDFDQARTLSVEAEQIGFAALCDANLGVLHARARRIALSIAAFDRARVLYRQAGDPARVVAIMEIDQAESLLHAGLLRDALAAANRAARLIEPTGNRVVLADSQLMIARVSIALGAHRAAISACQSATTVLVESGRTKLLPQALAIETEARLAGLDAQTAAEVDDVVASATDVIAQLLDADRDDLAATLRLARIRHCRRLRLEDALVADVAFTRAGIHNTRRDVALAGWYAEAIGRSLDTDLVGALDACRCGLDLLDEIVAEAPTLEQRSAAMRLGNDLSQLAIEFAIELGEADTVLAAAEGTRARALHDEMAEQRRHKPLTIDGARQLRRELAVRLGSSVLVEWVIADGDVWAVVFEAGVSRLVRLGSVREILRARDRLVVWLDRAGEEPDGPSASACRAAALLDEMLIAPLELAPAVGIVLVPVGGLHGIPWSGLPTFAGRAVVLSPSARLWLEADRRAAGAVRSIGVIVGPDVAGADAERSTIEGAYEHVTVAAGRGAGAAAVRSMFGGLDLVHVAAHGTFRSDHPLLSTLRLHDGESTLYDTVPDRVQSRIVVLSSCEGGAHGAADGSEVLGLAAVMLARGAAGVLAPLTIVRDLECADFVGDVHRRLAIGEPLAAAVANVRQRWLADDDLSRWAVASSFTCFGSGAVSVASA